MIGRLFKQGRCRKYEFYDIMINEMLDNGWENLSKTSYADGDVMWSKGESGDKDLFIQIKDHYLNNRVVSSVKNTNYNVVAFRFPMGYTPGIPGVAPAYMVQIKTGSNVQGTLTLTFGDSAGITGNTLVAQLSGGESPEQIAEKVINGVISPQLSRNYDITRDVDYIVFTSKNIRVHTTATCTVAQSPAMGVTLGAVQVVFTGIADVGGTFDRPLTTWNFALLYPVVPNASGESQYDREVLLDYAISVNKDSVIFILTPPAALNVSSIVTYVGLPDESLSEDQGSDGLIFASTFGTGYATGNVSIANKASELGVRSTDKENRVVKCNVPTTNPNAAGFFVAADMLYEDVAPSAEGTRGKINSILFIPNKNVAANDIVKDGNQKYRVVICQAPTGIAINSFASTAILYCYEN